jgi:hypothetical protein
MKVPEQRAYWWRRSSPAPRAAGAEVPQRLRRERQIGGDCGVLEVAVVGGEQVELVILGALVMNPLAVDHHPQLKSPDRQLKPGLEAIDISSDRLS